MPLVSLYRNFKWSYIVSLHRNFLLLQGTGEDAAQVNHGQKELEKVCSEQAAKIEELNSLVTKFALATIL